MTGRLRAGSLRFRLTVLATAAATIVLAATAAVLVVMQQRQLIANLDASLAQRADAMEAEFAVAVPDRPLPTSDQDRAVQLVDSRGRVVAASSNIVGDETLRDPLAGDARQHIETRDDLPLEDDAYRVLSRRIEIPTGEAVLHVAENIDDAVEATTALITALALTVPAVSALLAVLIWWLTGRTLGPVDAIRAEVDAITATHSDQRIQLRARDDEISRLATTMNRMLDRLDEAAATQRRFVADAAHELRTPLTRIRTAVEVDLAQPGNADPVATSVAVREDIMALQHLIDDLLHLARSDAGSLPRHHRPLDLDDLVMVEVEQHRSPTGPTIDATGVSAAHLNGDRDQLARIVRNLLANAVRHARSEVTVTLSEHPNSIVLAVADDGAGVPLEHRDRIFERFARVDDARSAHDGGAGLGLAITRDIVDHHDGTIVYDSASNGGARFVVTLPPFSPTIDGAAHTEVD